jgi:hypothetical protein
MDRACTDCALCSAQPLADLADARKRKRFVSDRRLAVSLALYHLDDGQEIIVCPFQWPVHHSPTLDHLPASSN